MNCPNCSADNRPGATFCGSCGRPLRVDLLPVCDACNAALRVGARFCHRCGRTLSAVVGAELALPVEVSSPVAGPQPAEPQSSAISLPGVAAEAVCPNCGQANRTAARFCHACRAPLLVACGQCGQENRVAARFCRECGALLAQHFPVQAGDGLHMGVFGHSMGGHGALTLALRHPELFRSVSALAPIAAPMQCPWGVKAFSGYLGEDRSAWAAHDATELIKAGARCPPLLVDQGEADKFLAEQLHPHLLEAACLGAGQPLTLRRHAGYDHGYYFIASVVEDHLRHHARALCA